MKTFGEGLGTSIPWPVFEPSTDWPSANKGNTYWYKNWFTITNRLIRKSLWSLKWENYTDVFHYLN